MYGVVLWSDSKEDKAVIWCEDHGDLAFYRQSAREEKVALDAGDWVQFDVTTARHMRYAHNPRLVAEGVFEGLVQSLPGQSAGRGHGAPLSSAMRARRADIIAFSVAGDRLRRRKMSSGWS